MTDSSPMDVEANDLFWKSYATSVLKLMTSGSTDIGPNSRVFIASSSHSAIPGGNKIPQEITNWGIYNLADKLLDANSGVTFNPSGHNGGYVQALDRYLGSITPAPNPNPVDQQIMGQLQSAKDNAKAADKAVTAARKDAVADYNTDPNGKGTTNWNLWYPANAPELVAALRDQDTTSGEVMLLTDQVDGPGVGLLNQYQKVLTAAQAPKPAPVNPGITMEASMDDITMDSNWVLTAPDPLNVLNAPAYSITGYGETIDDWMLTKGEKDPVFTSSISASVGRQFDAKAFGHSDSESSSGIDLGFFSIGTGSTSTSTDSSNFRCGKFSDEITLTLTVNFAQIMTISPGTWDVNVVDLVAKMGATPPSSVQTYVRPTQALFASGVGLTVQFGAASATAFDTFYSSNSHSGTGGFSIFGFHCTGDNTSNSSTTQVTSKSDWDSIHGKLTIKPAATAHNAQLLAVMGEVVTL